MVTSFFHCYRGDFDNQIQKIKAELEDLQEGEASRLNDEKKKAQTQIEQEVRTDSVMPTVHYTTRRDMIPRDNSRQ